MIDIEKFTIKHDGNKMINDIIKKYDSDDQVYEASKKIIFENSCTFKNSYPLDYTVLGYDYTKDKEERYREFEEELKKMKGTK